MTSGPRSIRFGTFTLDLERFSLARSGKEVFLRPKAFDVLRVLAENPGRVVSKNELIENVWPDLHVSDDALVQCVRDIRTALSDDERKVIRTIPRRGYMFASDVATDHEESPVAIREKGNVTYCQTEDGVRIAIACEGQGLPIIRPPTWFNHLAYDWNVNFRSGLYQAIVERAQLVRYDGRGSGMSDRYVQDISFQTFQRDLSAVVRSHGAEKYALLGISQGGAVAIEHAARHPDRVAKLILNGAFALGKNRRGSVKEIETGNAYLTLMRHGWGDEHSSFLRSFGTLYFPGASVEELRASAEVQRMAMTGDIAVRTSAASQDIDITALLPRIAAPTLILHSRHDNAVPFEEGLRLAEHIPNARFVALESENHCPMPDEPAWAQFIQEVCAFLEE